MKESDIRPAELFDEYLKLCAADAITYFADSSWQEIPCPACGSSRGAPAFIKWGFGYVTCENCASFYQSPRPPQEDFARFYQESPSARYWARTFFPAVAEARRIQLFRPKVAEILRLCQRESFSPRVVMDVGAGYGLLLEEMRRKTPAADLIALEPNPDLAAICRAKGFRVVECFAEEAVNLEGEADLAVALEVIEHVYEPLAFCCSLNSLLKASGRMLLTGLTVDGFDIQVLWEHSKSVSPPQHINFISVKGFEALMRRAGFSRVHIFTPGKLDVDIVRNVWQEAPHLLQDQRFIRSLLGLEEKVQKAFQKFLSEHQLSSHCWLWAVK